MQVCRKHTTNETGDDGQLRPGALSRWVPGHTPGHPRRRRQMFNMTKIEGEERQGLVEACQRNDWLMEQGIPWEDDPYLEEYPYEFARAKSIEDLASFFAHGNWALRQGAVFGDIAFIQQVDGGDEWWTLKKLPDGSWLDFDSCTLRDLASDRSVFTGLIAGMQLAIPDECASGCYGINAEGMQCEGDAFPDEGNGFIRIRQGDFCLAVTGSRLGNMLTVQDRDLTQADSEYEGMTLLQAINAEIKSAHERADAARGSESLAERAQSARLASATRDISYDTQAHTHTR